MAMLLMPLLAAAAQASPPPESVTVPTIVVVAKRTEKELADCLARKCGVRDDAIASIHHAQAQFANGEYPDARKTLLASINRNRKAEDSRAMSALWHALARVTLHNGDREEHFRASLKAGSILARAQSVTPAERVRGEIQVADAWAATGESDNAARRYGEIEAAARARGEAELADMMKVRAIAVRSSFDGRPFARLALERLARDGNLSASARASALAIAASFQERETPKVAKLLDAIPTQSANGPTVLIYSPRDDFSKQRETVARAVANNDFTLLNLLQPRGGDLSSYKWADIGYWVRPDGRVEGAELLRGSRNLDWAKAALKQVSGRRYAPFEAPPGAEGRYRIERVTLTYDHGTPAGSMIRRRAGLPSFRYEELKIEDPQTAG